MNEEWKKKNSSFPPHFQRTTETPNKKKKMMNEQVFVTTSDTKTSKAISVDLETFAVSDVLSSLMGDSDDRRLIEGINLRSTRTGQMFPISFSKNNSHHLQSSFTPSLRQLGVQNNDHFILQVSLLGGGGDGGATGAESRSAYLEMYNDNPFAKKKETLGGFVSFSSQSTVRDFDKKEDELSRYFNCSLTEEMLDSTIEDGIVVDLIGNLYNKEAVLKCLQRKAVEKLAAVCTSAGPIARVLLASQAHRRAPRRAVADVEEAVDNKILAQRLVKF